MQSSTKKILVCGGGLAGNLTALALAAGLGDDHDILQIDADAATPADIAYGNATPPGAYNFLHGLGLDEPHLILNTNTSFSHGTRFQSWLGGRSWVQAHHAPFQTIAGIPLRHFLTRSHRPLEPLLISAQAILAGRFAHPPSDPKNPLSQAEYGFQFHPPEWSRLIAAKLESSRVQRMAGKIVTVQNTPDGISGVTLDDGQTLSADLYIDASGPGRAIMSQFDRAQASVTFRPGQTIRIRETHTPADQLGPPCCIVDLTAAGWAVTSALQGSEIRLDIGSANAKSEEEDSLLVQTGHLEEAWIGNCVAIGQSACALEPLTPAPMMMLQRDIERLLELIPSSTDASMERREFNRRHRDDVVHARLFHDALFDCDQRPHSPYWNSAASAPADPGKLDRKLSQFSNRGILASYDLEPFSEEDWTIAHLGTGRWPRQPDRQVDRIAPEDAMNKLGEMERAIAQLVSRMPPHHVYVDKLKHYFEQKTHA